MTTDDNIVAMKATTRTVADWQTTWRALDRLDCRLTDMVATFDVLDDVDGSDDDAFEKMLVLQRHLRSDLEALVAANKSARAKILGKGGAR